MNELKTLLGNRRRRIAPESVGLPVRGARRTPGLRREDVAELLGVSPLWYSLFESGTSGRKFSATFVHSVCDVLQFDQRERDELMQLVIAGGHGTRDVESDWQIVRWACLMANVADASRRLAQSISDDEAVTVAMSTLRGGLTGNRIACTYFEARDAHLVAVRCDGLPAGGAPIGSRMSRSGLAAAPVALPSVSPQRALLVPVFARSSLAGAIRIDAERANAFSEMEVTAARILADHLGYVLAA